MSSAPYLPFDRIVVFGAGAVGSVLGARLNAVLPAMLIGRLGPLTLLAALTFNLKPVQYNYPEEAIIVG